MFKYLFRVDKEIVLQHDEQSFYLPFVEILDHECNLFIVDLLNEPTTNYEASKANKYLFAEIMQVLSLLEVRGQKTTKISLLSYENNYEISGIKKIILLKTDKSEQF